MLVLVGYEITIIISYVIYAHGLIVNWTPM